LHEQIQTRERDGIVQKPWSIWHIFGPAFVPWRAKCKWIGLDRRTTWPVRHGSAAASPTITAVGPLVDAQGNGVSSLSVSPLAVGDALVVEAKINSASTITPSLAAAGSGELFLGYGRTPGSVLAGSATGDTYDQSAQANMVHDNPNVSGVVGPRLDEVRIRYIFGRRGPHQGFIGLAR
jgi:hypothetical protein